MPGIRNLGMISFSFFSYYDIITSSPFHFLPPNSIIAIAYIHIYIYVYTFISTTEANVVMDLREPKTTILPNKQSKAKQNKQVFGLKPKDQCNPSHLSRKLLYATNKNYYKSHNQSKYKIVEPIPIGYICNTAQALKALRSLQS